MTLIRDMTYQEQEYVVLILILHILHVQQDISRNTNLQRIYTMPEFICPHCKNPIYDDEALTCLYCGESLNRDIGFMGKIKYSWFNMIINLVALIAIISFILLILR